MQSKASTILVTEWGALEGFGTPSRVRVSLSLSLSLTHSTFSHISISLSVPLYLSISLYHYQYLLSVPKSLWACARHTYPLAISLSFFRCTLHWYQISRSALVSQLKERKEPERELSHSTHSFSLPLIEQEVPGSGQEIYFFSLICCDFRKSRTLTGWQKIDVRFMKM